jgi:hypothetical protein
MTTETQADFGRRIGVGRSRINALKDAGRIVMAGDKVDVEASLERIKATRSPQHDDQAAAYREPAAAVQPAPTSAPADDKIGNSYQAARAVKERYFALEAKRAYEQACGQLMRADEVASAVADAATTLRTRLESLPDTLASALSGPLDEAQRRAIIAESIEHLLAGLAYDFRKITEKTNATA